MVAGSIKHSRWENRKTEFFATFSKLRFYDCFALQKSVGWKNSKSSRKRVGKILGKLVQDIFGQLEKYCVAFLSSKVAASQFVMFFQSTAIHMYSKKTGFVSVENNTSGKHFQGYICFYKNLAVHDLFTFFALRSFLAHLLLSDDYFVYRINDAGIRQLCNFRYDSMHGAASFMRALWEIIQ